MPNERPCLDVIVPVHQEAATIGPMLHELHAELVTTVEPRLIVCEDGSTDATPRILRELTRELPIHLISGGKRKGYARALIDGLRVAKTAHVLVVDSDGQCDPRDFPAFWRHRDAADIVVGWRRERSDGLARRLMSRSFGTIYDLLFGVPVHDPSCPYALIRRDAVLGCIDDLGLLEYGFWWELLARAHGDGWAILEVPVHHRPRLSGDTRVFKPGKIPSLAATHLLGLAQLWLTARRRVRDG